MTRTRLTRCICAAVPLGLAAAGHAQGLPRPTDFSLEIRSFGGDESQTYVSAGASGRFERFTVSLTGTASKRGHFTVRDGSGSVIDYGGYDIELGASTPLDIYPGSTAYAGVTYINTPEQHQRFAGVARVTISRPLSTDITGSAGASALLLDKSTIVGLTAALRYANPTGFSVYAQGTLIVAGQNTRSTWDGTLDRKHLYEAGVTYTPTGQNLTFSVGVTNTLGTTTGASLTPSLGSTAGLFVRVSGRM